MTYAEAPVWVEIVVANMIQTRRRWAVRRIWIGFVMLAAALGAASLAAAALSGWSDAQAWAIPAALATLALGLLSLLLLRAGFRRLGRLRGHTIDTWARTAMVMRQWCVERQSHVVGGLAGERWAALWLPGASDPNLRPVLLAKLQDDVNVEQASGDLGVSMERGFLAELGFRTSTLSEADEVEVIGDPAPGNFVLIRSARSLYLPLDRTVSGRPDDWRGREFIPR